METKTKIGFGIAAIVLVVLAVFSYAQYDAAQTAQKEKQAVETQVKGLESKVGEVEKKLATEEAARKAQEQEKAKLAQEAAAKQAELEAEKAAVLAELAAAKTTQTTTVAGEVLDDIALNDPVNFVVDDQDIAKLFDGQVKFDDEMYDAHEEFSSATGAVVVAISLTEDEKFGASPYLVLQNKGALTYSFVFDEPITVADISDKEPLVVTFLGQKMEIVELTASEAVIRSGKEVFLKQGESATVDGKTVKLEVVSDTGKAYVTVNGESKVVEEFESEEVGGLDIRVEDVISNDNTGFATLVIGADTIYEQDLGGEFFDDEQFVFDAVVNAGKLEAFTVTYDEKRVKLDKEFSALAVGEALSFPNDYISIKLTDVENTDYLTLEVSFDDFAEELEDGTDVDVKAILLEVNKKDAVKVLNEEVEELYVGENNKVYFADNENEWFEANLADVTIVNDEAVYTLVWNGGAVQIVEPTGTAITLATDMANERLGALEEEAEATDIKYGAINLGEREYDVLTLYGTVIVAPENAADNDQVTFKLPSDKVEAVVTLY